MPHNSAQNNLNVHLQSIEWLKDLFNHAHDLIQIVAADGTMMYVNKAWSTLLGYNQEDILGKPIQYFIDENDRQRYTDYRADVMSGKISDKPIIFYLKTKNSGKVAVEGVVSVKLENGNPLYTRGIFRDITGRIENEKALSSLYTALTEREYNLQQLLTYAPDAIVVTDNESRITYWNPKAEEIFGWTSAEIAGKRLSETIIPEQYREAHEQGMKRYLLTGEARVLNKTIEITALKRSGEEFYISLTISQASQHSGIAFVAFIRDIHHQKQSQRDLENKTKQLELSNKSLEAFAYATSHDLKQPVRKIQIFSERLLESASYRLDEGEKVFLRKIHDTSVSMRNLIDDLLNYASLSSVGESFQEVDLNELFKEVITDLEAEIQHQKVKVEISNLPVVTGNARQLQQLFYNLLENSVKYTQPNSPNHISVLSSKVYASEVALDIPSINGNGDFHQITIRDTGIGFDQQHVDKIFDMFTRLHTQRQYKGTGVGLSIVLKVVENHHGYIKAEGVPGQGSIFRILLPVDLTAHYR